MKNVYLPKEKSFLFEKRKHKSEYMWENVHHVEGKDINNI